MLIEIENTSSPGASFTANTNSVLLKIYEWIIDNNGATIPFVDFRRRLEKEKGVNDNNNRNIFPLLKNGGLVSYEPGSNIQVDYFYTKRGLAYVKTLESVEMIKGSDYTDIQKEKSISRLEGIQKAIICDTLGIIITQPGVSYAQPLQDLIRFLIKYNRVDKTEYAYLIYARQNNEISQALKSMNNNISAYRSGNLTIEVDVKVSNDIETREKTKAKKRKEGLAFLTSYAYFTSLLQQAGLIEKDGTYYCVVEKNRKQLELLGGLNNEEF